MDVWKVGIEVATDTIDCKLVLGEPCQGMLMVEKDVDLGHRLCCLPKDITLCFKGGIIKNGTLVGDGTKIDNTGVCFDKVRILGTWIVPEISTSMFRDLNYDNSLKDVVALSDPKVYNKIVIESGDYQVSAQHAGDVCLHLFGNTEIILNGTVRMVPNNYRHYYIFRMRGENIRMTGNGTIIGDKHTHTGETGEWGMGIDVLNTRNVTISGLNVKDCWGDCIYVGEKATNILIENCRLDNGRRQGISITGSYRVTVRNCIITNVAGTDPEYAIDVEPNKGETTEHVTIEDVTVKDCKGGIKVYGRAIDARVGTVTVKNCQIDAEKKEPIAAAQCDTLIVENSNITQRNGWGCVICKDVGYANIIDNTLWYDKGVFYQLKDWVRPMFDKKRIKFMDIENCGTVTIVRNKERNL